MGSHFILPFWIASNAGLFGLKHAVGVGRHCFALSSTAWLSGWGRALRNLPRGSYIKLGLPRGGGDLIFKFEGSTSRSVEPGDDARAECLRLTARLCWLGMMQTELKS